MTFVVQYILDQKPSPGILSLCRSGCLHGAAVAKWRGLYSRKQAPPSAQGRDGCVRRVNSGLASGRE